METIGSLIAGLDARTHQGSDGTTVTDVVDHSEHVTPGAVFIARSGARRDGRVFIADAVSRGAAAIICTPDSTSLNGTTIVHAHDPTSVGAAVAEKFHGSPSNTLHLIGVTGTNGKTTVAWLTHHILTSTGTKCGMLTTIACSDGDDQHAATLTTPGFCEVSRRLGKMVANGCGAAVMECSSHALDQGRTAGLQFDTGIYTNLSGDHMDYHGSIDAYLRAKLRLFDSVHGHAIINMDDPVGWRVADHATAPVTSCRLESDAAAAWVEVESQSLAGSNIRLHGPWGTMSTHLPLIGPHNAINALQATVAAWEFGVSDAAIAAALATATPPPGRLQMIEADGPRVLVDFAHTDDALEHVLEAVRPMVPSQGRLRIVFGCGGDRDRGKRPRMGRIAAQLADAVYATSDNPRSEDPNAILDQVLDGVPPDCGRRVQRIVDRREAIGRAIEEAEACDVVIIAGKGHERTQIFAAEVVEFDDQAVAIAALQRRRESSL
jgi:UDP-N-acetylmuramoyl-L-alanyl-D-glutamate--2,6-diaminopimelate ligase